jgi:hypothetical protein
MLVAVGGGDRFIISRDQTPFADVGERSNSMGCEGVASLSGVRRD